MSIKAQSIAGDWKGTLWCRVWNGADFHITDEDGELAGLWMFRHRGQRVFLWM